MVSVEWEPGTPLYSSFNIYCDTNTLRTEIIPAVRRCVEDIRTDIKGVFDTGLLRDSVGYRIYEEDELEYNIKVYIAETSSDYAYYLLHGFWENGRPNGISYHIPPAFWEWVYHHFYAGLDAFTYLDKVSGFGRQKRWTEQMFKGRFLSGAWEYLSSRTTRTKERRRVMRFKKNVPKGATMLTPRPLSNFTSLKDLLDTSIFRLEDHQDMDVKQIFKLKPGPKFQTELRELLGQHAPEVRNYLDRIAMRLWVSLQKKGFEPYDFWYRNVERLETICGGYQEPPVPKHTVLRSKWRKERMSQRIRRVAQVSDSELDYGTSPQSLVSHLTNLNKMAFGEMKPSVEPAKQPFGTMKTELKGDSYPVVTTKIIDTLARQLVSPMLIEGLQSLKRMRTDWLSKKP